MEYSLPVWSMLVHRGGMIQTIACVASDGYLPSIRLIGFWHKLKFISRKQWVLACIEIDESKKTSSFVDLPCVIQSTTSSKRRAMSQSMRKSRSKDSSSSTFFSHEWMKKICLHHISWSLCTQPLVFQLLNIGLETSICQKLADRFVWTRLVLVQVVLFSYNKYRSLHVSYEFDFSGYAYAEQTVELLTFLFCYMCKNLILYKYRRFIDGEEIPRYGWISLVASA